MLQSTHADEVLQASRAAQSARGATQLVSAEDAEMSGPEGGPVEGAGVGDRQVIECAAAHTR